MAARASWNDVRQNPSLYPDALQPGEGERLRWHPDADQPHSSQVFCVSAFGTLRRLPVRDLVARQLVESVGTTANSPQWLIELEVLCPHLLSEHGRVQASSIDVLLRSQQAVVCIEAKFLRDAEAGFGGCSQPKPKKGGRINCSGYFGPGSDLKTKTDAWCRLEVWERDRSPRAYWALGRSFFRDSVFAKQAEGETCPFNGPHYQLMRNFLFAAALAQRQGLSTFGVLAIAPARVAGKLKQQLDSFRNSVLLPQFGSRVQLASYERLIELLRQPGDAEAAALPTFLEARIAALIPDVEHRDGRSLGR